MDHAERIDSPEPRRLAHWSRQHDKLEAALDDYRLSNPEAAERIHRQLTAVRKAMQSYFQGEFTLHPDSPPSSPEFPRIWTLLALLFPRKVRTEVYEPALEELKADCLSERRKSRTAWERRWVTFCFTLRTLVLVCQSFGAWMGDRTTRLLRRIGLGILGAEFFRSLFK